MKAAWGLIVLAADLFQYGGFISVGAELCSAYGGGCNNIYFGPALGTVDCIGTCTEELCCIWHEYCSPGLTSFVAGDCPAGTTHEEHGGKCNGACDATEAECCPTATCGNTYDYTYPNACAKGKGPAVDVLCSTNGGTCDESICCVDDESCANTNDSDCGDVLWYNSAAVCDGACRGSGFDYTCCNKQACRTDFNANDCTSGTYTATEVCDGACDEAECCL
eukprot:g9437.t1